MNWPAMAAGARAASVASAIAPAAPSLPPAAGHPAWAWVPLLPAALALLLGVYSQVWVPGRRGEFWARASVLACLATLAGLVGLWATGADLGPVRLPGLLGHGLVLEARPLGLLLAALAAWLWTIAALFARHLGSAGTRSAGRFHASFLLCLSGTVGVFLSGDFFTLFVFFELVSLAAYPLVVHDESPEAISAGRLYLYLSIAGGLSLLFGTVYLESLAGSTGFDLLVDPGAAGPGLGWALALMMGGFAVKAGLVPLHVWLPQAHPVAPAPASALLSGVMIKTGAFGVFQVLRTFPSDWSARAGSWLAPLALATMLLGACLAAMEVNTKRLLAYSSVSQIGLVLLGAAMDAAMSPGQATAACGLVLHTLTHAGTKSTLFLLAGLIYAKAGNVDLHGPAGLGRRLPVTAAVFGLAALGLSGIPGFAGYGSKTVLHDALLVLKNTGAGPDRLGWALAETVLKLVSAVTAAYMAKLWYLLFMGGGKGGARPEPAGVRGPLRETTPDRVLVVLAAVPLVLMGLAPAGLVRRLVAPALAAAGYPGHGLEHLWSLHFWSETHLWAALTPLLLGALLFLALARRGFQGSRSRRGPSIEELLVRPALRRLERLVAAIAATDRLIERAYAGAAAAGAGLARLLGLVDRALDRGVDRGLDRVSAPGHRADQDPVRAEGQAGPVVAGPGERRPRSRALPRGSLNSATMVMAAAVLGLLLWFLWRGRLGSGL